MEAKPCACNNDWLLPWLQLAVHKGFEVSKGVQYVNAVRQDLCLVQACDRWEWRVVGGTRAAVSGFAEAVLSPLCGSLCRHIAGMHHAMPVSCWRQTRLTHHGRVWHLW